MGLLKFNEHMEETLSRKVKISFDFDDTLRNVPYIQVLCKRLLLDKNNVIYIITKRWKDPVKEESLEVYRAADLLGIPIENVFFTDRVMKFNKIAELGIEIHYDDELEEIALIRRHTKCKAFVV